MKERPILFSAPMVRALLAGTKTQTRRVCKPANQHALSYVVGPFEERPDLTAGLFGDEEGDLKFSCPYGQPGDRLWVRETWAQPTTLDPGPTFYRADYPACAAAFTNLPPVDEITWKPSIHMFRKDSRILLEITGVRVERLQDISPRDAREEGLHRHPYDWRNCEFPLDDTAYEPFKDFGTRYSCASQAYRALWEHINGTGSWDANPWVWVVEFKRVQP